MADNAVIASVFEEMADVMEILGEDHFKILAFRKVSRALEETGQSVASIGPDVKGLTTIAGVGKGSAERIAEYLTTGKIAEHQALLAKVPPGLPALLDIPGLGPKTVALLWKQAGVDGVEALKAKLNTPGALEGLPGFGEKKAENLRKALTFAASAGGRVRIGAAMPLAQWLLERVRETGDRAGLNVRQIAFAGSLRRGRETIGDIDLVAAVEGDASVLTAGFTKLELVTEVLGQGHTKASVRTKQGIQADLRVVEPAVFGATLLYFTGSKEHNVRLRERAQKMGMKLNEYGLFKGEELVAAATEEQVYQALGLRWIPPELREDRGEVEQAEKGELPELLRREDIAAELHSHTTASDGKWSIREIVSAAIDRGFHTLAITDHSKSQFQANGLSEERLEAHIEAVRAVAAEVKGRITVLAGSEVDILADGTLDYSNALLKELDLVVASPHAALSQEPAKATKRLLKAMNNPYVTIMGHPTGRLVLHREGLHPEMKELVKAAKARGVALEINANSHRLDLRDAHARMALEAGVKLAINTDAHGPADLDELNYGVLTARRAGATRNDVVNCLSRDALKKWIASTRA